MRREMKEGLIERERLRGLEIRENAGNEWV
jgi:hypothetical protein